MSDLGYAGGQDFYAGMERPKATTTRGNPMSKRMNREEAEIYLRDIAVSHAGSMRAQGDSYELVDQMLEYANQALSILAPEPRTEKPGVEGTVYRISNDYMQDIGIVTIETGLLAADVLKVGDSCTITSALPMPKGGQDV